MDIRLNTIAVAIALALLTAATPVQAGMILDGQTVATTVLVTGVIAEPSTVILFNLALSAWGANERGVRLRRRTITVGVRS